VQFYIDDKNRLQCTGNFALSRRGALENSIKKWSVIVDHIEEGGAPPRDGGISTCNLCVLYYEKDCDGCPVNINDNHIWCGDTPYQEYDDTDGDAVKAAKKELTFLESLREPKE
jgi:hypothetical protein